MTTHNMVLRFALIAGLAVASAAWAINMQLGQILPYVDCQQRARYSATASFIALLLASVGAIMSWRAIGRAGGAGPLTAVSGFVGALSALAALVFIFALSMQGIASLVLSGCER